jgi:hypothetical protein
VLTHDYKGNIEQRLKNMLTSKNPELSEPPREFMDIYQELLEQENKK